MQPKKFPQKTAAVMNIALLTIFLWQVQGDGLSAPPLAAGADPKVYLLLRIFVLN